MARIKKSLSFTVLEDQILLDMIMKSQSYLAFKEKCAKKMGLSHQTIIDRVNSLAFRAKMKEKHKEKLKKIRRGKKKTTNRTWSYFEKKYLVDLVDEFRKNGFCGEKLFTAVSLHFEPRMDPITIHRSYYRWRKIDRSAPMR